MNIDQMDLVDKENCLVFHTVAQSKNKLLTPTHKLTLITINLRDIRTNWDVILSIIYIIIEFIDIMIITELMVSLPESKLYGLSGFSSESKCHTLRKVGDMIFYTSNHQAQRIEEDFSSPEMLTLRVKWSSDLFNTWFPSPIFH